MNDNHQLLWDYNVLKDYRSMNLFIIDGIDNVIGILLSQLEQNKCRDIIASFVALK
jgi:hypothetical protein